ncbi:DNA cytosine methyltransferase [Streptomyces sp. NBC_01207]|uniref:DNA cytosine methyltransferase n=1 Tax=Streptomyces sp. NBC_01207 TaxID=2903772 RepID=UPI002E165543|nr:DNA (cytosine-5-)-methyltransferase [Streptomyces sp. NBC_01207]
MDEIRALPWNGFTAASSFSGCGGSSLGYRLAGFRVGWASEFIPAAQDTYRANAAPYTILDTRDIREVTGAEIVAALGLAVGELDLWDGSPPCASFSTAGKGAAGWGETRKYSDTEQRTDDLFFEYTRLVEELQPRTFVAENVSGLVKGAAKGYFKMILAGLKAAGPGYRVEARLLNAARLGVPQSRQRLIFVGVRSDLDATPAFPKPLPYQYTVREALPWVLAQGHSILHGTGTMRPSDYPSPTIMTGPTKGCTGYPPGKVIALPATRVIHETGGQPQYSGGDITDKQSPTILTGPKAVNSRHWQVHTSGESGEAIDPETGHNLHLGRHAIGEEWLRLPPGEQPAQDGQLWAEARKLTLRELRAIGGFPDDFALTGTYAQRWERIGRAVPPVMMGHIAGAVRDQVLIPLRDAGRI